MNIRPPGGSGLRRLPFVSKDVHSFLGFLAKTGNNEAVHVLHNSWTTVDIKVYDDAKNI